MAGDGKGNGWANRMTKRRSPSGVTTKELSKSDGNETTKYRYGNAMPS
jgi:hypothetical protein